jgi:hypothetical protein
VKKIIILGLFLLSVLQLLAQKQQDTIEIKKTFLEQFSGNMAKA